jgi:DNA-binding transcriptional LysR family regulator
VDLLECCRVFMYVAERGGVTEGAAAAGVAQSVASRRVRALEVRFGEQLLDRTGRRVTLTPFGQQVLPSAKRLVRMAEAVELHAERARLLPLSLAVPPYCPVPRLAALHAAAQEHGLTLDFRVAPPAGRQQLMRSAEVRAALLACPPDVASWTVELGVAGRVLPGQAPLRLSSVRPTRRRPTVPRLWLHPEDDVPHVHDHLRRAVDAAGLRPSQLVVGDSALAAVAGALRSGDLVVASALEAQEAQLQWRPLAHPSLARGYAVAAASHRDARRLESELQVPVARLLGVDGGAAA